MNFKVFPIFLLLISASFSSIAQNIVDGEIKLADGNRYSNSNAVAVDLNYKNAVAMIFSTDNDFSHGDWVDYKSHISSYPLPHGDGKKTLYVKFKLKSGKETEVFSDFVIVDTKAPENIGIELDIDGEYYNDPSLEVVVLLRASGAKYMQLSNTKAFYANKWMLYKDEIEWKLEPGNDGPRFVYVRFKDAAQNQTEIISTMVNVDREAPFGGELVINRGEKYSIQQDKKAELAIRARNADFMQISTESNFKDAEWIPYNTHHDFHLGEEDGEKTVYIRFKDKAGNMTDAYSSKIILDTTPPKDCQIIVDGGAEATSQIDKYVNLELKATEDTQYMMISNSSGFFGAKWMIYKPSQRWRLDGEEDGERIVYVKFRDKAGNVSAIFSDKIILQRDF